MNKFAKSARRGFTMVEVMIVVLILSTLMTMAVPNFVRARESSRGKSCIANLKRIDSAKEQWAFDNKKTSADTPAAANLYGVYTKSAPSCPSNGTYTINAIGISPVCSVGNNNTAASTADDHILP